MNIELLRQLMKKNGFIQKTLAEAIGVPQGTIASWMVGKGNPKHDALVKLSEVLKVSIPELLGEKIPDNYSPIKDWMMIKVVGKIPAGFPTEAIQEYVGEIAVKSKYVKPGYFALRVRGDSMSPRLLDGDTVVIAPCPDPHNGDIVAIIVNSAGETTLKRFQKDGNVIKLLPDNPSYNPIFLTEDESIRILGKVVYSCREW